MAGRDTTSGAGSRCAVGSSRERETIFVPRMKVLVPFRGSFYRRRGTFPPYCLVRPHTDRRLSCAAGSARLSRIVTDGFSDGPAVPHALHVAWKQRLKHIRQHIFCDVLVVGYASPRLVFSNVWGKGTRNFNPTCVLRKLPQPALATAGDAPSLKVAPNVTVAKACCQEHLQHQECSRQGYSAKKERSRTGVPGKTDIPLPRSRLSTPAYHHKLPVEILGLRRGVGVLVVRVVPSSARTTGHRIRPMEKYRSTRPSGAWPISLSDPSEPPWRPAAAHKGGLTSGA